MKPSEIEQWLADVKLKAGGGYNEGFDKVKIELRYLTDKTDTVALHAYLPDGNVMSLLMPIKG